MKIKTKVNFMQDYVKKNMQNIGANIVKYLQIPAIFEVVISSQLILQFLFTISREK